MFFHANNMDFPTYQLSLRQSVTVKLKFKKLSFE